MEHAGVQLEKIVAASLSHVPKDQAPVLAWPLVCGSAVAERTHALDFSKSLLRIEVPDAGWKRELQNLAPRYLAALNRYASGKVQKIEFIVRNR